jgi:hypothetical protein
MLKKVHIIAFLVILFLTGSCDKKDSAGCFTNTGPLTTEKRESSSFRFIEMNDNVDVYLSYAPQHSIEVRSGKNIIPGIKTDIDNETLRIYNKNSCNWVRSYKTPIEVHVAAPVIDSIVYQSSGNLISSNQFINDSLKLDVLEGGGSIQLWVDLRKGFFNLHYGTVDLNIRGSVHINYLSSRAYGPAKLQDLDTEFTYMSSYSTNNCWVRATNTLHVSIMNVGDVYYYGDPESLQVEIIGEGNLYKQ